MEILDRPTWGARAAAHAARVDGWIQPHLDRRRRGVAHPVHDFLFSYYSQRPAALRRWHPGFGVVLLDAEEEYADQRGYSPTKRCDEGGRGGLSVSVEEIAARVPLLTAIHRLLVATESRPPTLGCFGLHEWAMVHRTDRPRHPWPLRLGSAGTDRVVESHRITCSHFDAFRFFTPSARPLNALRPSAQDREAFEQPGCLHAGMDLYKHSFRLTPLVPSELVADCFALAWDIRELDMRASPYDFSDLGFAPVPIETPEGKRAYVEAQRGFAERGAPLRRRLVEECERLLAAAGPANVAGEGRARPSGPGRDIRRSGCGTLVSDPMNEPTDPQQRAELVARFVKDGRLVIVPSKRAKLRVVLDHIAQSFEPGRTYPEQQVNEVLQGFHPDHAALRRYLVDEGFLTREAGVYWRSGGTVEV